MSAAAIQTDVAPVAPAAVVAPVQAESAAPASAAAPSSPASAETPATVLTAEPPAPAEKAAEAAPAEAAEKAAPAPEDLALKFPEGVTPDAGLLEGFTQLAKATGMGGEAAQKLVTLYAEAQQRADAARAEAFQKQQQAWADEVRADKDVGGQAFEANVATARRAIERFGTPALRQLLNETGLGNHPEMVRLAVRVGRALAEDSVAGARAAPQATQSEDAVLAVLYPSMRKDR